LRTEKTESNKIADEIGEKRERRQKEKGGVPSVSPHVISPFLSAYPELRHLHVLVALHAPRVDLLGAAALDALQDLLHLVNL
jgi:hypothetical protein